MSPSQIEGFLTYYYEYHFLYINGIEHVESKNIQGATLMKLVFHQGTEMNQAMAEVVGYVNRARAFMPPGTVPPFITRFDTGSVPIAQLVFSSPIRSAAEIQELALNRVRPLFATLEGVSAPPPFGGNHRTIVVRIDPNKLRQYRMSPEEAIAAVNRATTVLPAGNVRTGDLTRIVTTNSVVGGDLKELENAPIRLGSGSTVFLRDIGVVENGTDLVAGYAHVNGKRTVYIQVTKRADASTLAVMNRVRAALPAFRSVVPEDVEITLEFDQSGYVRAAIRNLLQEAVLGAALAGLMVLVFLGDWRSALIVITTIPSALVAALIWLWASGQTINIMTLGGLTLAVGVLVDEATVAIESIHTHMAQGQSPARAVLEAAQKTALPRLLSMLCLLAVFLPSFFMVGAGRQLFAPQSLAVGFAMLSSYVLSSTLVPVLCSWMLPESFATSHASAPTAILHRIYSAYLHRALQARWVIAALYLAGCGAAVVAFYPELGQEIFPATNANYQFQLRLRAPAGTRIERTELPALQALELIYKELGRDQVRISTGFIGTQPPSYPVNTIYLFTSGPHEVVLRCALKPMQGSMEEIKERLRRRFARELPHVAICFEPADMIGQVMNFGSPTPIEVAVQGPDLAANRAHAAKIFGELKRIPYLRDLQYAQAFDYPALEVFVDRQRAGQFGLHAAGVVRSLVPATSSSRLTDPNYWRDPNSGNAFQIQVEIPQHQLASAEDVRQLPVMANREGRPLLGDLAEVRYGTTFGSVERYNMQRVVSMTANIHATTLGEIAPLVRQAIARAGEPPRGAAVNVRGQIPPLEETLGGLKLGLLAATVLVFLLLAANFQSFRLALAALTTIPAVLAGVVLTLRLTADSLNVQSFIGAIMASGIAMANAILLVSFAERALLDGLDSLAAAREGAQGRFRAILMTATAMIAGMLPMAIGMGEGADQNRPLGLAVVGGLALATFATPTAVPAFFAIIQKMLG